MPPPNPLFTFSLCLLYYMLCIQTTVCTSAVLTQQLHAQIVVGVGGLESRGLSHQTSLAERGRNRVSEHHLLVPGSLTLWLLACSEQGGLGVDLPCVSSLSVSTFLSFTCLSCVMSTAGWESRGERQCEGAPMRLCMCMCLCEWLLIAWI